MTSQISRRKFLAALPLLPAATRAMAQADALVRVYFGTDTTKGVSKGIYSARFNSVTGELTRPMLMAETARPSYLALHPGREFLYAVNALPDATATVSSFNVGRVSGHLTPLKPVSSHGDGPCYVAVHPGGEAAYVANYVGGSLASYGIRGGQLSAPVKWLDGNAVPAAAASASASQTASHLHCATFSPDGFYFLACDLGRDRIYILRPDLRHGSFIPNKPQFVAARAGSGPRHVAFHPNGRWVYCIHELDSTIDLWDWRIRGDNAEMTPRAKAVYSTVDSPTTKNAAAEVAISADGQFLYASNRGEDTLVVYAINSNDGTLQLVQRAASEGNTPRHFAIDATGNWLLVANQDSATVQVMRRNADTGKLLPPESRIQLDSVMFTLFD